MTKLMPKLAGEKKPPGLLGGAGAGGVGTGKGGRSVFGRQAALGFAAAGLFGALPADSAMTSAERRNDARAGAIVSAT